MKIYSTEQIKINEKKNFFILLTYSCFSFPIFILLILLNVFMIISLEQKYFVIIFSPFFTTYFFSFAVIFKNKNTFNFKCKNNLIDINKINFNSIENLKQFNFWVKFKDFKFRVLLILLILLWLLIVFLIPTSFLLISENIRKNPIQENLFLFSIILACFLSVFSLFLYFFILEKIATNEFINKIKNELTINKLITPEFIFTNLPFAMPPCMYLKFLKQNFN
ncbi:hypothetical protein [Mycoplasmopsis cricetuli]|uniref:hypothetical protein n=1 Tax=Mycoplasmopsis cricetuli TaxID=171283 RepID=UPI000472AA68|nr:hypothetical protein [Mycoplasmopsis cricetuli]